MPLLQVLDVIKMYDAAPGVDYPKMVVCVAPDEGYFFRINEKPWRIPVKLLAADHPFLDYDSHLECSPPLDVDDYTIEQYLDENGGPFGRVHEKHIPAILDAVNDNRKIANPVKAAIRRALGGT